MAFDYIVTTRNVRSGAFGGEPGPVRFLKVPAAAEDYSPADATLTPAAWAKEVIALADGDLNPNSIGRFGDVLVFIHGYNNDRGTVLRRLRLLSSDLRAEGWHGVVIAFDWPSEDNTLNYLEDRSDAAKVAVEVVRRCVTLIATGQEQGCETNIHLLGHSTGAYVIMEAFAQAEKRGELYKSDWRIGQVAFIAGDVAASTLAAGDEWAAPMFRRIMRLTNYSNPYDAVLAVSNAKRLGVSPRAGRVGLPPTPYPKATNVDCGDYFKDLDPEASTYEGNWTHSWHIGNRVFARDLAMTLEGAIDRSAIPTRRLEDGALVLQDSPRPAYMAAWDIRAQLEVMRPLDDKRRPRRIGSRPAIRGG